MKIFKIETTDAPIEFKIPEFIHEVSLKQFDEYQRAYNDLPEWYRECEGDLSVLSENQIINYKYHCVRLLSVATRQDLDVLLNGSINEVLSIWVEFHKMMFTYEPKIRDSFEYKGRTYTLPKKVIHAITGEELTPNLTTIEAILLAQYNHLYSETEVLKKGGFFWKVLSMTAIISRAKGEIFPLDDAEIESYTAKRIKHFEDLSADVGLDVWFFFASSLLKSKRISIANSLLKAYTHDSINKMFMSNAKLKSAMKGMVGG